MNDDRRKVEMARLPIYCKSNELINLVKNNKVVILVSETGSGKSTQVPQILYKSGFAESGQIYVTQPRRVAAKSLANRVSFELGSELGQKVGYGVRYETCDSQQTKIKFMTDGMLLMECVKDPILSKAAVIIIDEVHQRTIHTSILLGILKQIQSKRKQDLKILISSATLNPEEFVTYFGNAPVLEITGRNYNVEIVYMFYCSRIVDVGVATVERIAKICQEDNDSNGSVLVFLPGVNEINLVMNVLSYHKEIHKKYRILPFYASQPFQDQSKVFQEDEQPKLILATNVAETSLTIPGITVVIDLGIANKLNYDPYSKEKTLETKPISKFEARQRAGRAGRTQNGKCFRLYDKEIYDAFEESPRICQINPTTFVLQLLAAGVRDAMHFDYFDKVDLNTIKNSLWELEGFSAFDVGRNTITKLGRLMAEYPVEAYVSRSILESVRYGCSCQTLKIAAMLSTDFHKLFTRATKSDLEDFYGVKSRFESSSSDLGTLLCIFDNWNQNSKCETWAQKNYLNHSLLTEADKIYQQLELIFLRQGNPLSSYADPQQELIRRTFYAGFKFNRAIRVDGEAEFKTVTCKKSIIGDISPKSKFRKNQLPRHVVEVYFWDISSRINWSTHFNCVSNVDFTFSKASEREWKKKKIELNWI